MRYVRRVRTFYLPLTVLTCVLLLAWQSGGAQKSSSRTKSDPETEDAVTPRRKKSVTPAPKAKPAEDETTEDAGPGPVKKGATPKKKTTASAGDDVTPDPGATPAKKGATPKKKSATALADEGDKPGSTPRPKKSSKSSSTPSLGRGLLPKAAPEEDAPASSTSGAEKPASAKTPVDDLGGKLSAEPPMTPPVAPGGKGAPPVSIESSQLVGFSEQPAGVRTLIEAALALSKQGLTYKYGSDDPANGGMDCSGSIAYLLRSQGFKDVPRDSAGQYTWARKNGDFFAVISKKAGGFEFDDLKPGDLMFWSGTYSVERDPPVTHTMIYLGEQKGRKQRVMWGASDGRTYDGKSRYGVGVFDFKMPKLESDEESASTTKKHPDFLGYARIPGLREEAKERK